MSTAIRHPPPLPLQNLLENYTTSHPLRSPSPLPPSSRVDPKLTQRTAPPTSSSPLLWTIWTWIAFARFIITKGLHILGSLLSHWVYGPKRKSWGYRMTFITSVMRNVADHTSLADIVMVRRLISLHQVIPLPADAVVTPITFTVPLQTGDKVARGFLREWDLKESGKRELTGEWVVGTEVWRRLKVERRKRREQEHRRRNGAIAGGRSTSSPTPANHTPSDSESQSARRVFEGERVIYYVHGGAYYVGNAATHRLVTIGISKACNARVFAITYRLAPEHVFPLPLHDVLHGYLRLLAPPLSIPPENIVIMGDSAGGGLSLALCMYLRDEGYKMPAGLVLMSPWVDLTMSCGSWDECAETDVVPRPEADDHLNPVGCYLGPKGIATYLTHPYASPLFGDLRNLPPMLIQSGDSEVLRDEITLLAHKATLAGNPVSHELYEDMVHVFQMFPFLKAATTAITSIGRWVRITLPQVEEENRSSATPDQISSSTEDRMDSELQSDPTLVSADGGVLESSTSSEVLPDEQRAARDHRRRRSSNALALNVLPPPKFDLNESPEDRSGSPTPTSRTPTIPEDQDPFIHTTHAPRLRRALTGLSSTNTGYQSPHKQVARKRRITASGPTSVHHSPSASVYTTSNPTSPTPSLRRMRVRSPTISSPQPTPTTRARSQSHSDIHWLVEEYVEGGAANQTVVYAPGGEIRSVGVLGQEED